MDVHPLPVSITLPVSPLSPNCPVSKTCLTSVLVCKCVLACERETMVISITLLFFCLFQAFRKPLSKTEFTASQPVSMCVYVVPTCHRLCLCISCLRLDVRGSAPGSTCCSWCQSDQIKNVVRREESTNLEWVRMRMGGYEGGVGRLTTDVLKERRIREWQEGPSVELIDFTSILSVCNEI